MERTLLILDDDEFMSKLLTQFLGKKYKIKTLPNGLDGLDWMQQGNIPDLIIADLMMPEIDGFEFIKNVRASGFFKEVPIIVLSSKQKSEDRIKCFKLGADDYLVKPFNPEELALRIETILKRTKAV